MRAPSTNEKTEEMQSVRRRRSSAYGRSTLAVHSRRAHLFHKSGQVSPFITETLYSSVKSKRIKAQISNSIITEPLGFSKNAVTKSFLELFLIYNSFCLKRRLGFETQKTKLQKLRIAIFGQIWLKLAVFPLIHLKKMFSGIFYIKNPTDYAEATDMF